MHGRLVSQRAATAVRTRWAVEMETLRERRLRFSFASMLAAIGLAAVALVLLQRAVAESSPEPSSQPALPVILPLVGCATFAFAALGMLLRGVGGAGSGLFIGVVLGLFLVLLFGFLDLRFLGP